MPRISFGFVSACACAALLLPIAQNASARTLAEIKSLGAISMCANRDALPYASNKPETPGFQIEIGRAIAEGLGVPLNIEWILPRRRANVVNCDMLFDSINDPEIYEGRILLTRPYQKSGLAIALRGDAPEIASYQDLGKDQKIGVMVGSMASMVLGKAGKRISPYAFQSDMLDDLRNGELYAAAISAATTDYYVKNKPESGLRVAYAFEGVKELSWDVAIGLRKSDAALQSAINEVLDRLIADGTLTAIYAKYGVQHRVP